MKINHDNYEALLLDYIEGRLNASTAQALRRFIDQHPSLGSWEELTADLPLISEDYVDFPDKTNLLMPEIVAVDGINEHNFEEYFIAWYEGALSADEKTAVERFLMLNPSLKSEFRLAGMVYVLPDTNVVFSEKEKLIKKAPVIQIFTGRTMRVAATIALLFTLSVWWFRQIPDNEPGLQASIEKPAAETNDRKEITPSKPIEEQHATYVAESLPRKSLSLAKEFDAQTSLIPQQRYETLPILTKKVSEGIILSPYGSLAFADDDLETRLLIAMMLESGQTQQQTPSGRLIRQAVGGFGKTLDLLQRGQERLVPENVLSAGVGIYNMLTDNDVEIVKEYESGQLQAVALQSERLGWRRTLP